MLNTPNVFLLHTHYIPDSFEGILVVEHNALLASRYLKTRIEGDLSVLEYIEKYNHNNQRFSLEGDYDPNYLVKNLPEFVKHNVISILPFRKSNLKYYSDKLTSDGERLLNCMENNSIILDCTHMSAPVITESLNAFNGQVFFSHSILRLENCSRHIQSNIIPDSIIPILKKRDFLIGIPLINDILSLTEPISQNPSVSMNDLLKQIQKLIEVFGFQHIAIGGDFFDFEYYSQYFNTTLKPLNKMDTKSGFIMLSQMLLQSGYSSEIIDAIFYKNAFDFINRRDNDRAKRRMKNNNYWSFSDHTTENIIEIVNSNIDILPPPTHAWIALCNYCNLSCKHCRSSYKTRTNLSKDIPDVLYSRLCEELIPNLKSLIIGGNNFSEVTLSKRFPEFINYLSLNSPKDIQLSLQSNGSIIKSDILERMVDLSFVFNYSVEGGTKETTKRIRGISLDVLQKRIAEINHFRKLNSNSKSRIVLSFTAMKSTITELDELALFAEINGVDEINIMFLLPPVVAWNNESLHDQEEYVNSTIFHSKQLTEKWNVNIIAPYLCQCDDQPCFKPWYSTSICANGDVRFCCLEDSPIIGNLIEDHFSTIWNSNEAKRIRMIVNHSPEKECSQCVLRNLPYLSVSTLCKHLK